MPSWRRGWRGAVGRGRHRQHECDVSAAVVAQCVRCLHLGTHHASGQQMRADGQEGWGQRHHGGGYREASSGRVAAAGSQPGWQGHQEAWSATLWLGSQRLDSKPCNRTLPIGIGIWALVFWALGQIAQTTYVLG